MTSRRDLLAGLGAAGLATIPIGTPPDPTAEPERLDYFCLTTPAGRNDLGYPFRKFAVERFRAIDVRRVAPGRGRVLACGDGQVYRIRGFYSRNETGVDPVENGDEEFDVD